HSDVSASFCEAWNLLLRIIGNLQKTDSSLRVGMRQVEPAPPDQRKSANAFAANAERKSGSTFAAPAQRKAANAFAASATVAAISSLLCAADTKPASNALGAKYTPASSIAWKKRL